jgi:hypothetical protein
LLIKCTSLWMLDQTQLTSSTMKSKSRIETQSSGYFFNPLHHQQQCSLFTQHSPFVSLETDAFE